MSQASNTGNFDASVVETLLVLILKSDVPSCFKDFRPIMLLNIVY